MGGMDGDAVILAGEAVVGTPVGSDVGDFEGESLFSKVESVIVDYRWKA